MNITDTVKLLGAMLMGVVWVVGMIYIVSTYLP